MNPSPAVDITVLHNQAAQQFEVHRHGATAVCAYRRSGDVLDIHHTEVPEALAGRGLAGALVAAALAWAREQGLKVRPSCSYAAAYMARRPETQALLAR